MLLTQAARDLRTEIDSRWARLQGWLAGVSDSVRAKIWTPIASLYDHWNQVNKGLLSDTDEIDGAYHDLETAETYAVEQGYQPPPGYHGRTLTTADLHPLTGTAQRVENAVKEHTVLDKLTSPKDQSLMERAGGAALELPWWVWATGLGGIVMVGTAIYASYKAAEVAAPFVMAAYAPGLLPHYQALKAARSLNPKLPEHVQRALEEELAR